MTDYYLKNRDTILQKNKEYRLANREKIAQNKKDDMAKNGEARRAKQKEWRDANREKVIADRKRWFQENKQQVYEKRKNCAWTPEKQAAYMSEYRIKNKEQIRERLRAYQEGNENYKIKHRHLGRIRLIIKRAAQPFDDRDIDGMGCSRLVLIAHIKSLFKPGMTWENYGKDGWEVDHIKPISSFDLTDPEQQKICFHYTNLQPLWRAENMAKGKKTNL